MVLRGKCRVKGDGQITSLSAWVWLVLPARPGAAAPSSPGRPATGRRMRYIDSTPLPDLGQTDKAG